jgi:hypothetical protein
MLFPRFLGISPPILSKKHAAMPCYHIAYQCFADLFRADGISQRDLALGLQTPLGTIKTRIELGISKLARMFRQFQAIRCSVKESSPSPSPKAIPPEAADCLEDSHFEERIGFKASLHALSEANSSN